MQLEPIIRVKLQDYRKAYELDSYQDGVVFERFANQTILTNHQPDAFSVYDDLLDLICVGGSNDMGIDGLCIKINGIFVRSVQDIKDQLSHHKKTDIEFLFIQSKYKEKFDSGEYAKFINGITDFLGEDHYQPRNEKISMWLEIKSYLMSDDVMKTWIHNPTIRAYYIVMGTWNNSPHIIAISQKLQQDIANLNAYGELFIKYIDASAFKKICDDNDSSFRTVFNVIDTFSLTAVDNVDNSSIILCFATELLRLLVTEEGIIRKSLFNDNVRDFQGDTTINHEIYKTIKDEPMSFVLLNNGITIVCDEVIPGNRKVTIVNPQIVNGCQTCNVIYMASKNGLDISQVVVSAKIISTRSDDITNKIVKGTNRQNIVYDEAFEVTKEFHKDLEDVFSAMSSENQNNKIYYERRSKQYFSNPLIKPSQKVNLRILIQSFISIFLNEPHNGHRHESKLLQDYRNRIFIDKQSKLPYYTASLLYIKLEGFLKSDETLKRVVTYRSHLSMIIKELAAGKSPSINDENEIDKYSNKLLAIINNEGRFINIAYKAVEVFEDIQERWISQKGNSFRFGIKDSSEFTTFLLSCLSPQSIKNEVLSKCRGRVKKVGFDRNGTHYGFISRFPDDIFFHAYDNMKLDFSCLQDKEVLYNTVEDTRYGGEKAVDIQVIS